MRQSEQQTQARDRAEQQRTRAEWEAVMEASRAAQRDGSVDFKRCGACDALLWG